MYMLSVTTCSWWVELNDFIYTFVICIMQNDLILVLLLSIMIPYEISWHMLVCPCYYIFRLFFLGIRCYIGLQGTHAYCYLPVEGSITRTYVPLKLFSTIRLDSLTYFWPFNKLLSSNERSVLRDVQAQFSSIMKSFYDPC